MGTHREGDRGCSQNVGILSLSYFVSSFCDAKSCSVEFDTTCLMAVKIGLWKMIVGTKITMSGELSK